MKTQRRIGCVAVNRGQRVVNLSRPPGGLGPILKNTIREDKIVKTHRKEEHVAFPPQTRAHKQQHGLQFVRVASEFTKKETDEDSREEESWNAFGS